MSNLIDLTGQTFTRLRVIRRAENDRRGFVYWFCRCECGRSAIVYGRRLRDGRTRSCGCLAKESARINGRSVMTHGHASTGNETPTYRSWKAMKERCTNANHIHFYNYGGRGIRICSRWLNSFENFLADMGERPEGTSIDRIDNNGNYEPDNCRWATPTQQQHNRRDNRCAT